MKSKKALKITKHLPANTAMEPNQFGAVTYGEWCQCEAFRIGSGARVECEDRGKIWCHVEKELS